MTTLYLHIGMNKAGSTSCQRLFHRNRELLAADGLLYLQSGRANHSFLMAACFGVPDARARAARRWGMAHEEAVSRWEAFLDDARAAGADGLVSAEMLGGGSIPGLERLRDDALRRFDSLVILALVRPPLAYARSFGQQQLKRRAALSDYRDAPPLPRYRARLERWLALVGESNLRLEIFHRDRLVDGDPARTLLAMMGRSGRALDALRAGKENPAMSMTAAKLLSALQRGRRQPASLADLPEPVLAALRALPPDYCYAALERGERPGALLPHKLARVARRVPGDAFRLPIEVQRAVAERSREEVAWVSRLLGAPLDAYDIAIDESAPGLDQVEAITPLEAQAIAAHFANVSPSA